MLAERPLGGLARRPVGAALEPRIAQPPSTALGHTESIARLDQISHLLTGIIIDHDGSHRHANHEIFAALARAVTPHPVPSTLGTKPPGMPEIDQGVEPRISLQEQTATSTAITAVGAAERDVFLATKADAAVAAITGFNAYDCLVDEFHGMKLQASSDCAKRFGPQQKSPAVSRGFS